MSRPARYDASFARKQGHQDPRACVLIVCEDAKASPNYFRELCKQLRLSTTEVEVYGKECGSDPGSVVNFALDCREQRNTDVKHSKANKVCFDIVYCVIDVDHHAKLKDALVKARDNKLELVVSCPCFEYWYSLHFNKTSKAFEKCDQLIKNLKRHVKGYDKGTFNPQQLMASTRIAYGHAKELEREQVHDGHLCNPSTAVYKLVEKLYAIAGRENELKRASADDSLKANIREEKGYEALAAR